MSVDKLHFWANTDAWPRDTSTHTFLGRATNKIGEVLFGAEWNGPFDVTAELTSEFPRWEWDRSPADAIRANNLLARRKQDSGRQPVLGMSLPAAARLSEEDWEQARDLVSQINLETKPAIDRFRRVREEIVNGAESGKLTTATRQHHRGGEFSPIPASWWNIDDPSSRFFMCKINPADPFGIAVDGAAFRWIFVTQESFDAYLRSLAPPEKQTVAVEGQCQKWLESQMALQETESWNRDGFRAAAKEKFGNALSDKAFLRAWSTVVKQPGNETRRRAGRRPAPKSTR